MIYSQSTELGLKAGPRFGEFCSCCTTPAWPCLQHSRNLGPAYSRALFTRATHLLGLLPDKEVDEVARVALEHVGLQPPQVPGHGELEEQTGIRAISVHHWAGSSN